jgi:hypothetical protein
MIYIHLWLNRAGKPQYCSLNKKFVLFYPNSNREVGVWHEQSQSSPGGAG